MLRMVGYGRVSTKSDEQIESLKNQRLFFEEYAQRNCYELVHVYADEGISGTKLKRRTQFMRLLQDAEKHTFDVVVVKDVSRFARNTVDLLQSIRALKSLGINTIFVTANMTSLGDSELVLAVMGAVAQEESANISKRVKFGKKIAAQQGRVPQWAFGYKKIDKFTMEIVEEEAVIVRDIFKMYIEDGMGCRKISLALNARKAKTKFGGEWTPRTVRRILDNPIYGGDLITHKYEIRDYMEGKQYAVPAAEQYHHDRPDLAIVCKDTFAQAQAIKQQRAKQYEANCKHVQARYSTRHVFSTLIKCECCGRSFSRKLYRGARATTRYWKCPTNDQLTATHCANNVRINEQDLLDQLRIYFRQLIGKQESFIDNIVSSLPKYLLSGEAEMADVDALRKKKTRLLKKTDKYQEMFANDMITLDTLKEKVYALQSEIAEIEAKIHENGVLPNADEMDDRIERYKRDILRFLQLESITNMDMRKLIEKITVNPDGNVRIYLKKFI